MTLLFETYVERAAEFRRQAEETALANVRERCLRSAVAWEEMAERVRTTEEYRLAEVARKAGNPLVGA